MYKYDNLLKITNKFPYQITNIKIQYFELLQQLTNAPLLNDDEFINKINEISKIGFIIVCYIDSSLEYPKIKLIGTGTIFFEPKMIHGGKSVGHIEDIVVDKNYRKEGIGKKIIRILIELNDPYKVILDCNDKLINFYQSCGFKKCGNQMAIYKIETVNGETVNGETEQTLDNKNYIQQNIDVFNHT